jgi:multiple sugar transport system substrate-binding protein
MQNVGIWGMAQMDDGAPDVPYGVFQLPKPADGQNVSVGGGWAFCANARGRNPEAAGEFCGWALAGQDDASVDRMVDWCTVAKTNLPPRAAAVEAGSDKLMSGKMAIFSEEILPTSRAEPRVPPEVYKIISDAIQAAMLGGVAPQDAAEQASEQLDAFLSGYDGAPIL